DQVIENTLPGSRRQKYTLAEGIYLYVSPCEWQLVDERPQQSVRWEKSYPLQPGSSLHIPRNGVLSCRPLSREDSESLLRAGFPGPEKRQYRAWLQGDSLQQGLWVRLLRPDDVIQPIGRKRAYP